MRINSTHPENLKGILYIYIYIYIYIYSADLSIPKSSHNLSAIGLIQNRQRQTGVYFSGFSAMSGSVDQTLKH